MWRLLAALIFGLHPAHIEAVAWISGVTEPLLGIFLIASFLAYVQSRAEGAHALQMESNFPGAFRSRHAGKRDCTDTSRPSACLRVDLWDGVGKAARREEDARVVRRRVSAKSGLTFFLIALYVPARIYALKGFSHVVTPLSTAQLVFTWPSLVGFWIRHLIWPAGLSTFYNFTAVLIPTLRNFILPAIFDICCGARVVRRRPEFPPGRLLRSLAGAAFNPSPQSPRFSCQRLCP